MSAKLVYSFSDENPDLQKQFGCMNGLLQLFDRRQFFAGRRISGHSHKKVPSGQSGKHTMEQDNASQSATDINSKKVVKDKQRMSNESSRTSFSSSSCSSAFSSVDCNRTCQPEQPSPSQTVSSETTSQDLIENQLNPSLCSGLQSHGLHDVVKDSINREGRGLSVRIASKEVAAGRRVKHIDSPRPSLSNSVKPRFSGFTESLGGLAQLRESPRNFNAEKDGPRILRPKDAPRFSYDGRESRETFKSTIKLKELPRLSLDSKRNCTTESRSNYLLEDLRRGIGNSSKNMNLEQEPGSNKRPSSVVAKLMGLEDFPDSMSINEGCIDPVKTCMDENSHPFPRSSKTVEEGKQNQIARSPRNSCRDPTSPRMKNATLITKPSPSSKFPIETAPWRHADESRGSQKRSFKCRGSPMDLNSSHTVYGEIEKRLAELEFRKSGKDLRALKQILEAMHKTKEVLEAKKEDQTDHFLSQTANNSPHYGSSPRLVNKQNPPSNRQISARTKGMNPPKGIVVMKPAKLMDPTPPLVPDDDLSGLGKLSAGDSAVSRKDSVGKQTSKDLSPRHNHLRGPSSRPLHSIGRDSSVRTSRSAQGSKEPPNFIREKSISSKSSGTTSPRLQPKQLGLEKHSHHTTQSLELSRARKQPSGKLMRSGSPSRAHGPKTRNFRRSEGELSEISSETRNFTHQGDTVSSQSESNISLASQMDIEVTSTGRSDDINSTFQHGGEKCENPGARLSKDGRIAELAIVIPEQPSPVSVLDPMFYRDDSPSPVKKIQNAFQDDETLNSDETEWDQLDVDCLSNSTRPSLSSSIHHKNFEFREHTVQMYGRPNSADEELAINYVAFLGENTKSDHRYVSEILLASGLLGRDLVSGSTAIQPHSARHLINPNLFLVLEQTSASSRPSNYENYSKKIAQKKLNDKIQRKLIFDAVDEILARKVALAGSCESSLVSPNKLVKRRSLRGQQLLKEVCLEIDQLQAKKSECSLDDGVEDDESLRGSIFEDLSDWIDFHSEMSGLVLDVERLIFKDLVVEVISGEAAGLQARRGGTCRQLFTN
ncbi:protein LONGIFOLIA 1-like [Malania oleifera]|uniref:protein LONGIFOLIA 1-like n=1 Tax=Malania oleifera TaxID=397392 RepID=UPI0025AE2B32|nr:protein LONGIFOLIA 1-like [Malania oleifera]